METLLELIDNSAPIKDKITKTDVIFKVLREKNISLHKLEKKYKKLTTKLIEKNDEIEKLKQKYEEIDIRLSEYTIKYIPLEKNYAALKTSYDALEEDHNKFVNRAEAKYQSACKEVEELHKTCDQLRKNVSNNEEKEEITRNTRTATKKKENFKQLKEQCKLLEEERNKGFEQLSQIQLECNELKTLLGKKNNSNNTNSESDLLKRIEILQEELKYSKDELKILKLTHQNDILHIKEKYELESAALTRKLQQITLKSENNSNSTNTVCNKSVSTQTELENDYDVKQIFKEMIIMASPLTPLSVTNIESLDERTSDPDNITSKEATTQTDNSNDTTTNLWEEQQTETKYLGHSIKIKEYSSSGPFKIKTFSEEYSSESEPNPSIKENIFLKKKYKYKFNKLYKMIQRNKSNISRISNKNMSVLSSVIRNLSKAPWSIFSQVSDQFKHFTCSHDCGTCHCSCHKPSAINSSPNCRIREGKIAEINNYRPKRLQRFRSIRKSVRNHTKIIQSNYVSDTEEENNIRPNQLVTTKLTQNNISKMNKITNRNTAKYKSKEFISSCDESSISPIYSPSISKPELLKSKSDILLTNSNSSSEEEVSPSKSPSRRKKISRNKSIRHTDKPLANNLNSSTQSSSKSQKQQSPSKENKSVKFNSPKSKISNEECNVILNKYLDSLELSKKKRRKTTDDTDSGIDTISNIKSPPSMIEDSSILFCSGEKSGEFYLGKDEELNTEINTNKETTEISNSVTQRKVKKSLSSKVQNSKRSKKRKNISHDEEEYKKMKQNLFGSESDTSHISENSIDNSKSDKPSTNTTKNTKNKSSAKNDVSSVAAIIKNDAKYDQEKFIESRAKNNKMAVKLLKEKKLKNDSDNVTAKLFKKPEKSNIKIIPACPKSPDVVEYVTTKPKIIPLETSKLDTSMDFVSVTNSNVGFLETAKKLVRDIATMDWDQELMTIVTDVLSREDADYVAKIIVNEAAKDFSQEFDKSFTPPAPLMTKTQQKLLVLLSRLEKAGLEKIYDSFISYAEQRLLSETRIEVVHTLTRLYVSYCRLRYDIEKVRMLCCNAAYHMGDLLTPLVFIVVSVWGEVIPLASKANDVHLAVVLVQVIRLKTCQKPGYNLFNLKQLLTGYYGYQADPENNDEIMSKLVSAYSENCAKVVYTAILILCKNLSHEWTYKKIKEHFMPLIENNIANKDKSKLISMTIILISRLVEYFDPIKFKLEIFNLRNWMLTLTSGSDNLTGEVKVSLSTCISTLADFKPKV